MISLISVGAPFFIMSNSQEIRVISKNIMTGSPKCNSWPILLVLCAQTLFKIQRASTVLWLMQILFNRLWKTLIMICHKTTLLTKRGGRTRKPRNDYSLQKKIKSRFTAKKIVFYQFCKFVQMINDDLNKTIG